MGEQIGIALDPATTELLDGEPDPEGQYTYKLAKEGRSLKTSTYRLTAAILDDVHPYDAFSSS